MTLSIVEAALATQEPLDPSTLADIGAWAIRPLNVSDYEFAFECANESKAEIAAIDAMEADAIARVKARADHLRAKAQPRVDFFLGRIAEAAERDRPGLLIAKKKTREFLSGSVSWRSHPSKVVVEDRAVLVEYLTKLGDLELARIKVEPDLAAIQKRFQKDGVLLPGCTFESERESLTVKTADLPLIAATITKEMKP